MKNESILLSNLFDEFIKASGNGRRRMSSGKKISKGVLRNYESAKDLLLEYEKGLTMPLKILILNRVSVSQLKTEKKYWQQFFTGFTDFLYYKKKCCDSYVSSVFKILKSIFNYIKTENGWPIGEFYRAFKIPVQHPEPVILLPEQVYMLINAGNYIGLHGILSKARDIIVFGCTTGLRIGDLMALKKSNLLQRGNEYFIALYTLKTGQPVHIPLPGYCMEIVEKYKLLRKAFLLPRMAVATINKQIKIIGKKLGWIDPLPKYTSRQGKIIEVKHANGDSWKFNEHLTCHTMRRTAITTLLMLGVDEQVVRKVSGHAPGSKEFYKYVAIAQTYMDHQVKIAFERLTSDPEWYKHK